MFQHDADNLFHRPTEVTTDEWSFCLLPLDDDVISMELPEFFRDNFLVKNEQIALTASD